MWLLEGDQACMLVSSWELLLQTLKMLLQILRHLLIEVSTFLYGE